MVWSQAQQEAMFSLYWETGQAECPDCQASIRFSRSDTNAGYWLSGTCPRGHGNLMMGKGQDPLRSTFRKWTDEEANAVFDAHFRGQSVSCPVDGAPVDVQENPTNAANRVFALCPRCMEGQGKEFPHN